MAAKGKEKKFREKEKRKKRMSRRSKLTGGQRDSARADSPIGIDRKPGEEQGRKAIFIGLYSTFPREIRAAKRIIPLGLLTNFATFALLLGLVGI